MDNDLKSTRQQALKESPEEAKKIGKVVNGVVKTKKQSEVKKLARNFISDDIGKVKEFVWMDVLIPSIKKAISDIITNGIDMVLYGESGRTKKSGLPGSKIGYTSYSSMTSNNNRNLNRPTSSRSTYSYDDIILETRGEAETVIMKLGEIIQTYSIARVADLYDLVGITDTSYTDNDYGWTDIRTAQAVRVRDGYMIKLPRALPID